MELTREDIRNLSELNNVTQEISGGFRPFDPSFSLGDFVVVGNEPTTTSNSGYYGQAYFNAESRTLVISHGGTNLQASLNSAGDLLADAALGSGLSEIALTRALAGSGLLGAPIVVAQAALDDQISAANRFYKRITDEYGSDINIISTGFSLGGYLSQVAAPEGVQVVTFNSPGRGGLIGSSITNENTIYVQSEPALWDATARVVHTNGDFVSNDVFFVVGTGGHEIGTLANGLEAGAALVSAQDYPEFLAAQLINEHGADLLSGSIDDFAIQSTNQENVSSNEFTREAFEIATNVDIPNLPVSVSIVENGSGDLALRTVGLDRAQDTRNDLIKVNVLNARQLFGAEGFDEETLINELVILFDEVYQKQIDAGLEPDFGQLRGEFAEEFQKRSEEITTSINTFEQGSRGDNSLSGGVGGDALDDAVRDFGESFGQALEQVPALLASLAPQIIADLIAGRDLDEVALQYGSIISVNIGVDTLLDFAGLTDDATDLLNTEIGSAIQGAVIQFAITAAVQGQITGGQAAELAGNIAIRSAINFAVRNANVNLLISDGAGAFLGDLADDLFARGVNKTAAISPLQAGAAAAAITFVSNLLDHGFEDFGQTLFETAVAGATAAIGTAIGGAVKTALGASAFAGPIGILVGGLVATLISTVFGGLFNRVPPPPLFEVTENPDGTLTITVTEVAGGYIAQAREGFDDILVGASSSDALIGSDGNNELIGNGGNDRLDGRAGDDTAIGGEGHDEINGGIGSDLLVGGNGDDIIYGDSVLDFEEAENYAVRDAVSTVGEDQEGDAGTADDGSDEEGENGSGLGGTHNDLILAGAGNDQVFAGIGDDIVLGGYGDDRLFGDGGNDFINGEGHNDYIDGGFGDDTLFGSGGDDRLIGGTGNDVLYGGETVTLFDTELTTQILEFLENEAGQSETLKRELGLDRYVGVNNLDARPFEGALTLRDALISRIGRVEGQLTSARSGNANATNPLADAFLAWLAINAASVLAAFEGGGRLIISHQIMQSDLPPQSIRKRENQTEQLKFSSSAH